MCICMCIVYVDEFVWVFSTVYITSTVVFFAVTVLLSKELPLQLRLEGKQRGPWKIAEMLISSATTCPVTGESYRRRISAQIIGPRKSILGRSPKTVVLPPIGTKHSGLTVVVHDPGAAASEVCGEAKVQTRTRGICFSHVHPSVAEGPCTAPAHPPTETTVLVMVGLPASRQVIHW